MLWTGRRRYWPTPPCSYPQCQCSAAQDPEAAPVEVLVLALDPVQVTGQEVEVHFAAQKSFNLINDGL